MDSGEQFGISFRETVKKHFGNKGDFGNFSREYGNTDPLGASLLNSSKETFQFGCSEHRYKAAI